MQYDLNYNKTYLAIIITAFIVAICVISSVVRLQTTWVGIYNSGKRVMLEYDNKYSPSFFTKSSCEDWVKKQKNINSEGTYMCGKNCRFKEIGVVDCDQIYNIE
jgi:hypothetical protein